ncbi:MAG TPA: ATP-binding protein [Gemmatimonadaceae bacterium]
MTSLVSSQPSALVGSIDAAPPDDIPRIRMITPAGVLFVPDAALTDNRDAPARTLDRIAHLAALATHASVAQINLVSEDRRVPVAVHVDESRIIGSTTGALWQSAIAGTDLDTDESIAIEDTQAHPLTRDTIDSDDRVRSYAATRLKTPAGVVLGTVCVIDYEPRTWSPADRAALVECAALAGEELASHLSIVSAERSRVEAERVHTDAEAASRAKSEFLAALSRELREQLDTLGGYAALLEQELRGTVPTERREELRRVQLGQHYLTSLIDEVLNYTSLEQGATDFTLTDVGVRDALVEAEAVVAPQVRAKVIILGLGDVRGDIAVVADGTRLREILTNLLSNAVKFTSPGGRIDVTCDVTRTDVRIRVHDTGIGIPADKFDVIFEPFVQLRADVRRTVEAAGLGLAISRALARGQGGALTVESIVGSGSTFTLTLPRAKKSV